MGSSRKALRADEARRSSSAPLSMARSGAVTYALARAQCSLTVSRGGLRLASPMRPLGTDCGLRVADPDSARVTVMCGFTTRPAATLLATFIPPGEVGALNDVAITRDAVYVTDSFNAQLVKIPLPANGSLPSEDDATLLPVTGDFVQTRVWSNLNGIVAKNGALLVGQSNTGKLFRVDPATGTADEVDLGGAALTSAGRSGIARAPALRGPQR